MTATLVRRRATQPTRRAVLWIHGWSDYFLQTHVADYFVARGFDFYALDLRKHGRSLGRHQTANFCRSLHEYPAELDRAAEVVRGTDGHDTLLVMAHSYRGARWRGAAGRADTVLNVADMVRWGPWSAGT